MTDRPWLSQYPPEIPVSLTYPRKPVCAFLTEAAEQYPDKKALHFMGKEMTYREVYEAALKFAGYLKNSEWKKAIGLPCCSRIPRRPSSVFTASFTRAG